MKPREIRALTRNGYSPILHILKTMLAVWPFDTRAHRSGVVILVVKQYASMNQNKLVSVLSKIAILLLVFFIGQYVGARSAGISSESVQNSSGEGVGVASVMFDYGDGALQTIQNVSVEEGDSVFDVVERATTEGDIEMEYEDYGGDLGVFLQSIDGVGGGESGAWWQYWVNNEYGNVGMSSHEAEEGDTIFLKFTSGNPTE